MADVWFRLRRRWTGQWVAGVLSPDRLGAQVVLHSDSIRLWDDGINAGDGSETHRLWDRSFERLVWLREPLLRTAAPRRLKGQSTREIAESLIVSKRNVEGKLKRIRAVWNQEGPR